MGIKKRGFAIASDNLIYWIIGLVVLVLGVLLLLVLKGKAGGGLAFIKNLFISK